MIQFLKTEEAFLFICVHASLQEALSVGWLVSRSHGRSVGWSVGHALVKISENGFSQILNDLNSTILIQILERVIWGKK